MNELLLSRHSYFKYEGTTGLESTNTFFASETYFQCFETYFQWKKLEVGRRNKNQFTRKKGKKDNYCRWSVDIKSFEYTGFKQQWIMTIYIVLYNKGIQIINISLCRVEMISIQIFHLCDKLFLENGFFITKHIYLWFSIGIWKYPVRKY